MKHSTRDEVSQSFKEVYNERGYAVLSTRDPLKIGKIIPHSYLSTEGTEINQPLCIVSETTVEDAIEQGRRMNAHLGKDNSDTVMKLMVIDLQLRYHYRAVTE